VVDVFSQKLIPVMYLMYIETRGGKILPLKHINRNYFSGPNNLCFTLFSLKNVVFFK